MSATEIAAAIRAGEISSVEATRACLDRIERHNPELNAFLTVCAQRALDDAARADAAVKAGDAALMLVVTAGHDRRDPIALRETPPDFEAAAAGTRDARSGDRPLAGLRIGWSPDLGHFAVDAEIRDIAERAAKGFEDHRVEPAIHRAIAAPSSGAAARAGAHPHGPDGRTRGNCFGRAISRQRRLLVHQGGDAAGRWWPDHHVAVMRTRLRIARVDAALEKREYCFMRKPRCPWGSNGLLSLEPELGPC